MLLCLTAKQISAVWSGFEFPTVFEKIPVALEGGNKVKSLFPAGFDHGRAEIIAVKQHENLHTLWRFEFTDQIGGQLGGLFERAAQ